MEKGLIQVYTGEGKGKTTAAIGQAVRAVGRGYRVLFVQFFKEEKGSGEITCLKKLGVDTLHQGEESNFIFPEKLSPEEKEALTKKCQSLIERVKNKIRDNSYDLLVLDEVNLAVHWGFLSEEMLINFLNTRSPSLEVVLTGRKASPRLIEIADLVSQIKKVKHPFDIGVRARPGIEF